jgi:hypothetical protein
MGEVLCAGTIPSSLPTRNRGQIKELIGVLAARGYWTSPPGQTPHATLYAALLREIQGKAGASRFVQVGRGTFGLRATVSN